MKNVHNPIVSVPLRSGSVEVRELAWPDARTLYDKLVVQSKSLFDHEGTLKLDAAQVTSLIGENIELSTWLVLKATGKDEAWLNQRSLSEVIDVAVEAALLNISVITDRIKNARGRLQTLVAGQNTNPQPEATSSTPTLQT